MMKRQPNPLPMLIETPVKAGFPNPAEDAHSFALDLNELVVKHPASTFYVRVEGDSMQGAGILTGDMAVVDRSLQPRHRDIVIGVVDGEFTLKRFKKDGNLIWLVPENPAYKPIALHDVIDAQIWGVVTHIIRSYRG